MADQNITMSDETRAGIRPELLAFIERQAAQGITLPDAIVSEKDFDAKFPSKEYLEDEATIDGIMDSTGVHEPALRNDIEELLRNGSTAEMGAFSMNATAAQRDNDGQDVGPRADENDYTIITAPTLSTPNRLVHGIIEIPENEISPVVDTINPEDIKAYAFFHELAHSNHAIIDAQSEYEGDQLANHLYEKAYQEGVVTDPRVPEMFAEMRAIATFHESGASYEYPLNGMINADHNSGEAHHAPHEGTEDAMYGVVADSYYEIGKQFENGRHIFNSMDALSEEERATFLTPDQQEEFKRLQTLSADPSADRMDTVTEMENFMQGIVVPAPLQEKFDEEYDIQIRMEGYDAVHGELEEGAEESLINRDGGQPELLYTNVRDKLIAGEYSEDPATQQLAENFVLGAERLAPEHYNVADQGQTYEQHLDAQGTPNNFGYDYPPGQNAPEAEVDPSIPNFFQNDVPPAVSP